jgi:hypothetical protein
MIHEPRLPQESRECRLSSRSRINDITTVIIVVVVIVVANVTTTVIIDAAAAAAAAAVAAAIDFEVITTPEGRDTLVFCRRRSARKL